MEKIISYMETNRDLAMGRLNNTPQGKQDSIKKWDELASQINAVGEGTTKSAVKWSEYWNEKKYSIKKKVALLKSHATGTGGGPPNGKLNDVEERILGIMGPVAVFGEPAARIPFNEPTDTLEPNIVPIPPIPIMEKTTIEMEVQSLEIPDAPDAENTNKNRSVRRRRQNTEPSAPRWAIEMENRRLETEEKTARALQDIAKALQEISKTMIKIENKM